MYVRRGFIIYGEIVPAGFSGEPSEIIFLLEAGISAINPEPLGTSYILLLLESLLRFPFCRNVFSLQLLSAVIFFHAALRRNSDLRIYVKIRVKWHSVMYEVLFSMLYCEYIAASG